MKKNFLLSMILFSLACVSLQQKIIKNEDCRYKNIIVPCNMENMDIDYILKLFTDKDEIVESIKLKKNYEKELKDSIFQVITIFESAKPAVVGNEYIIIKNMNVWQIKSKDMWIE